MSLKYLLIATSMMCFGLSSVTDIEAMEKQNKKEKKKLKKEKEIKKEKKEKKENETVTISKEKHEKFLRLEKKHEEFISLLLEEVKSLETLVRQKGGDSEFINNLHKFHSMLTNGEIEIVDN